MVIQPTAAAPAASDQKMEGNIPQTKTVAEPNPPFVQQVRASAISRNLRLKPVRTRTFPVKIFNRIAVRAKHQFHQIGLLQSMKVVEPLTWPASGSRLNRWRPKQELPRHRALPTWSLVGKNPNPMLQPDPAIDPRAWCFLSYSNNAEPSKTSRPALKALKSWIRDWIKRVVIRLKPIGITQRNQTIELRRPWLTEPNSAETGTVLKDPYKAIQATASQIKSPIMCRRDFHFGAK